jgi:aldehyde:ferredoxin oxidoreductase
MADEWGLDTISLGSAIAFLMESAENGLIPQKIQWGDFEAVRKLISDIGKGTGLGEIVSRGVRNAAEALGNGAHRWAMQVKGLEVSAYNCHACPGMALSFATSPIGASHKDAWIIAWEVSNGRLSYDRKKVEKLIEFQRIRGGLFEAATVCRLPWVEVGFGIHWYPQYLEAATGKLYSLEELYEIADRIYSLIRAYWVRENRNFDRFWDYPPERWFQEAQSQGKMKGIKLEKEKYDQMLSVYYELRGWNDRGVPMKETLNRLGLKAASEQIYG